MGKVHWRKNVLFLVSAGYTTVLILFIMMVWRGGMTATDAYEVVQGPIMALVGGSLAISKDLIPLSDDANKQERQDDLGTSVPREANHRIDDAR